MHTLNKEEWIKLDGIILMIHQIDQLKGLKHFVLEVMPATLGAEFSSWNEHNDDLVMDVIENSASHHQQVSALAETLNRVSWSNPCFKHFFDTETGKIKLMETVESTRLLDIDGSYHQTPFYKEVASKLKIEDQLHMHLYIKGGRGIIINFHNNREFTPSEHLLCSILRGHILARLYTISRKSPLFNTTSAQAIARLKTSLTPREFETLSHLCRGISNSEIAAQFGISVRTVEKHVGKILHKLKLQSRNQVISTYGPCFLYQ